MAGPETTQYVAEQATDETSLKLFQKCTVVRFTFWPARKDGKVNKKLPRIGVYVCQCGINIAATVDVEEVTNFAAGLPGVIVARQSSYTCSEAGQKVINVTCRE